MTRQAEKHPTTTTNPLPSDQESRLTGTRRFNRKLMVSRVAQRPAAACVSIQGGLRGDTKRRRAEGRVRAVVAAQP